MNHTPGNDAIKTAALAYLSRGWSPLALCPPDHVGCTAAHVDHCVCPGKRPWIKWKKYQDQHATPAEVEHWFRQLPNSNVGIALGPVSGLVRIDVDGAKGTELLEQKSGGDLPPTLEFTSGNSGSGLLYSIPEGSTLKTTSDKGDGEHQELRFQGKGAQTVLPPSIHPDGRVYKWKPGHSPHEIEAALAPDWLVRELSPPTPPPYGDATEAEAFNNAAEPPHDRVDEITLAREALAALHRSRAANHDVWIKVGMALHATSDTLLGDWIQFSRLCPEKFREGECAEKWSLFARNGKVTLATLIHIAGQDGWLPPWKRKGRAESAAAKAAPPPPPWRPFPTGALPGIIGQYVREASSAIGCDESYIALPLLAAVASTIGNTRRIRLKRSWSEPSVVWAIIVGDSGTQKSPAWDAATKPLLRRQTDAFRVYRDGLAGHSQDVERHKAAILQWRRTGIKSGEPPPEEPAEPVARRFIVSDTTIEALAPILESQPRGVLLSRDELAGWLGSFDRYANGKGADVANWLSMHRAGPITVDRKTGKRIIHVPCAAVSITGSIQPATLAAALGREHFEDGLAARLLLAMPPRRAKRWTEADISDETTAALDELFGGLLALDFALSPEGEPEPYIIPLTPEAKSDWIVFYREHAAEAVDLAGDLAAAWSKIEGYAARLALLVALARAPETTTVDDDAMQAGVTLARWFAHEARRVYATIGETEESRELRRLVEWIEARGGSAAPRDVCRAFRRYPDAEAAEAALDALVKAGRGHWEVAETAGRPRREFSLKQAADDAASRQKVENPAENDPSVICQHVGAQKANIDGQANGEGAEWTY